MSPRYETAGDGRVSTERKTLPEELHGAIELLANRVDLLEKTLQTMLQPMSPNKEVNATASAASPASDLRTSLSAALSKVRYIEGRVVEITARVDLS